MAEEKKKYILNLVEGVSSFFTEYLEQAGFVFQKRDEVVDITTLGYIFVSSTEEANNVTAEYNAIKNEIKIICFEENSHIKDFLLSNGRALFSKDLEDGVFTKYLLNKFFSEHFSIHLEESFPEQFTEIQSFKVTNHLSIGLSLDEMATQVFKAGFNVVAVRSFVDHVTYYLSYLKQSGLAGIPFEVEYAQQGEFLAINIHASVRNFVAEYMIDAFGEVNSEKPLNYLLGIAAKASDFLDITYVENPGKIVLTGFFFKEDENRLKGISFNNIFTTSQVEQALEKRVQSFVPQEQQGSELEKQQADLANKKLQGGFIDLVEAPPADSFLADNKEGMDQLVDFLVEEFKTERPNDDIKSFDLESFENYSPRFEDIDFVNNLSDEDKKFLVERVKNNNLIQAYDDELNQVRSDIFDDPQATEAIQDAMGEELADQVASRVDASMLNSILNKEPSKNEEEEGTVLRAKNSFLGEFESNIPTFSADAAFDSISPDFADPTDFDSSNVFDSLSDELASGEANLDEAPLNIDSEEFQESFPEFGADGFDDLLPSDPGAFPIADIEDAFNVAGSADSENGSQKISGSKDLANENTMVKGGKAEADDFMQKISGLKDDKKDDFVAKFSSSFEEEVDKDFMRISGSPPGEREKEMKMIVSGALDSIADSDSFSMNVKAFINKEAPTRINDGLEKFAKSLGKSLDKFDGADFQTFKNEQLPEIMAGLVQDEQKVDEFKNELENSVEDVDAFHSDELNDFETKFKAKLESKLAEAKSVDRDGDSFVISDDSFDEKEMQTIVRETVKETFEDEFKFTNASPGEIKAKETRLMNDLAKTLQLPVSDIAVIIRGASNVAQDKEKEIVADVLAEKNSENDELEVKSSGDLEQVANTKSEAALIKRLKDIEGENKKLKTSLSVMELKVSATDDVKEKFESLMSEMEELQATQGEKVSEVIAEKIKDVEPDMMGETDKAKILEDIKAGKDLDPMTMKMLEKALENEQQVVELAKQAEMALKKAEIESEQKDSLFKSELEKSHKAIKAKELVLDKAKESMKQALDKKDKEVVQLKQQVNKLNQSSNNDETVRLKQELKSLHKAKETLTKTAELYKTKLDTATKNMGTQKTSDNSAGLVEENRALQRIKAQLENKLNAELKTKRTMEDGYVKSKALATKANAESVKAQGEIKDLQSQLRMAKDQNSKLVAAAAAAKQAALSGSGKGGGNTEKISKELQQEKAKTAKLEANIERLNQSLEEVVTSRAGKSAPKPAEKDPTQLNAALEMTEKEVEHLKDQNSKLHKKIEEMDKQLAKAGLSTGAAAPKVKIKGQGPEEKPNPEVSKLKGQNQQLQGRIRDLVAKLKKAESSKSAPAQEAAPSAKEERLAQSVKKMNGELTKAKSEAAELKKENVKAKKDVTGLKNRIKLLEKDLERAKKGAAAAKKKRAA